MWSNWLPRRWLLLGLFAVAVVSAGACAAPEWESQISLILERAEQGDMSAIEYDGDLLVSATDVLALFAAIESAESEEVREDLISIHLTKQDRIECILADLEEAALDEKGIKCRGTVIVENDDVLVFTAQVQSLPTVEAQREFVVSYVADWTVTEQIDRAVERLEQMNNTRTIPLVGGLLDLMTRFPVTWEGEELIAKDEIPDLLEKFRDLPSKDAKRELVETYLRDKGRV